jgi:hypothetical protein
MSLATVLKRMASRAITLLAKHNLARPAAVLARLTTRSSTFAPDNSVAGQGKPLRILLLPRSRFNDDTLSMLRGVGPITLIKLPRTVLKGIAAAFLPDELGDNNYISASPEAKLGKVRYREFLIRFWRAFDPKGHIDAVITGNFGYYAERELGGALETLGVPFIALHKENFWSRGSQEFWEAVYRERRGPFLGHRILVYSPLERDLQLKAGVVDEPRVEVVGMPRLDDLHRWRSTNVGRIPKPLVLFASFHPDVSMPVLRRAILGQDGKEQWAVLTDQRSAIHKLDFLCTSAHRAVLELAVTCPDIRVVVKTKGRARDRSVLLERLGIARESEMPQNLEVVHGGSPLPFLFEASLVCGLHSTLLLEGLAAGRPVLIPWYGEVLDPAINRYIFDLGGAVTRAASPSEFLNLMMLLARACKPVPKNLPAGTAKILREWLGNEDGKAGERPPKRSVA